MGVYWQTRNTVYSGPYTPSTQHASVVLLSFSHSSVWGLSLQPAHFITSLYPHPPDYSHPFSYTLCVVKTSNSGFWAEVTCLLGHFIYLIYLPSAGVLCGPFRRDYSWHDHWLCLLQRLQPEAPERPTFLDMYSGFCSFRAICGALQYIPFPSTIVTKDI